MKEIYIRATHKGEQSPVLEEAMEILNGLEYETFWVIDAEQTPIFISGEALGNPNLSGQYMLPVWTRAVKRSSEFARSFIGQKEYEETKKLLDQGLPV